MSEIVKELIKKEKPHLIKYKKYIQENDWQKMIWNGIGKPKSDTEVRKEEFDLQNNIILTLLSRLKSAAKKSDGHHHLKIFKDFVNGVKEVISIHTDRADNYTFSSNLTDIESTDLRSNEISFHRHLHSTTSLIQDNFSALNIKTEDNRADGIQWLDNQKCTLAMWETILPQYPEIKEKLDKMGIDFYAEPSPTLHILNENPPVYDPNKNFWEQEKDVLIYYISEYNKIDKGVTIDGYYIDGWLYFHFNFFVTTIPRTVEINGIKENKDETKIPELRDNEILITDYFIKSKREQTMSLISATRRAAKTTLNSSRIFRAQVLNKKQVLCAGGSSEDLNHIHNNLNTCFENINPAFKMYYLAPTEDGRGKAYGIKTKNNKSKITTQVFIINLEGGSKKSKKESLAGFSPDEFILDEAMKFEYKSQLEALKPALWGIGVLRCSVLITGTGGDSDLAKDAIDMLNFPETNKITLMDWDSLERNVPLEHITWKRRKYGLFLPTQMSIKHQKIKSNLADYLGIKSETLSKVPLWVTDWGKAKESEEKEREDVKNDRKSYIRLLAYHPFDPDEIFLSGKPSPFANIIDLAKEHRQHLIDTGKWDKRRTLRKNDQGKIISEISNKELIPFPFTGDNHDAPFLIIEPPDFDKNPMYYYIASGDFTKQESAPTTDSVTTISIMKYPIFGDLSGKKVVATYATRPKSFKTLHDNILLLLEWYNARFFPENEDMQPFVTFLEQKHLEDTYLEKYIDFNNASNYSTTSARRYGWTPKASKNRLMGMFVNYLEEDCEILNDEGVKVTVKRVQTIDDIHFLQEIINFAENQNHDRISGFLGNVGLIHVLVNGYIYPKGIKNKKEEEEVTVEKPKRKTQFYREGRTKFYSGKRR